MDFGDFPISAYRLLPGEALCGRFSRAYYFYSDCPLTKYSSKRLPEQRHHRTESCLKLVALFSHNDKRPTRGAFSCIFQKRWFKLIELKKYTYILEHLQQQIGMCATANHWSKGESRVAWSILTLVFIIESSILKEVYEAMTLRGYGMDAKTKNLFLLAAEYGLLLLN